MSKPGKFRFDFKKYRKLLKRGLCEGVQEGNQVCIEHAVSIACGYVKEPTPSEDGYYEDPDSTADQPKCVHRTIRSMKISLNDDSAWSSPAARAKGLKVVGVAQLGTSAKSFDIKKFKKVFKDLVIQKVYPVLLSNEGVEEEICDLFRSGKVGGKLTFFEQYALKDVRETIDNLMPPEDFDVFAYLESDSTDQLLILTANCMVEALRICKSPGIKLLKKLK